MTHTMIPKISILGKTNTGKSTLFNKLCNKRVSIVEDLEGVTIDSKEFYSEVEGYGSAIFVDTPGWEGYSGSEHIKLQLERAIKLSNVLILLLDATQELSSLDQECLEIVRRASKPTIVVLNKSDRQTVVNEADIYTFGLENVVYVSAKTGLNIAGLLDKMVSMLPKRHEEDEQTQKNIPIGIIGKPNVGKSTFFNKILGFDRVLTSSKAGTTRDAINHVLDVGSTTVELIDTAGLRKQNKISDTLEYKSAGESITAIRRSKVCILMLDATQGILKQDISIAHIAINEGKPLLILLNKIDLVSNAKATEREVRYEVEQHLPKLKGVRIIPISALKNSNYSFVLKAAVELYKKSIKPLSTGRLNKWLQSATSKHLPPLINGKKRIKLKYIVQTSIAPPTITIFANLVENLPISYKRYLENELSKTFDLDGVPLRISYKKQHNPYAP